MRRNTKGIPSFLGIISVALVVLFGLTSLAFSQPAWQAEWDQVQAAAKKEGKIVMAIPLNPKLRKLVEGVLKSRFGIEAELVVGRSSQYIRRLASEYQGGHTLF